MKRVHGADVRFGSLADVCPAKGHVRFTPQERSQERPQEQTW